MKKQTFIIDEERRKAVECKEAGTHAPVEIYNDIGQTKRITGMLPCPNCGSRFAGYKSIPTNPSTSKRNR